jgi:hypothetical protein
VTEPDDTPLARCRCLLSGIAAHARMLDEALPGGADALFAWTEAQLTGVNELLREMVALAEQRRARRA